MTEDPSRGGERGFSIQFGDQQNPLDVFGGLRLSCNELLLPGSFAESPLVSWFVADDFGTRSFPERNSGTMDFAGGGHIGKFKL